jgi:hypothetical protein
MTGDTDGAMSAWMTVVYLCRALQLKSRETTVSQWLIIVSTAGVDNVSDACRCVRGKTRQDDR